MCKDNESGLVYILNNMESKLDSQNDQTSIEIIQKSDKILLKNNTKVLDVVKSDSENYGNILAIIDSLRNSHD